MKRYLLFCFDNYYPMGGWHDFKGSFKTVEAALNAKNKRSERLFHIIDSHTGTIHVSSGDS